MSFLLLYVVAAVTLFLLITNTLMSRHIWSDERRTTQEKLAETGLVWVVPFFGMLVALAITLDGPQHVRKADPIATAASAAGGVAGSVLT